MLGLVFGGVTLVLGAIALVLTLLYWLAEGLRLYDRDIGPTSPDAAGRRPRRSATRRPHARAVVAPVPRRVRGLRAVPRPGLRWLAARGRGHRPHRDPGRLADRRRPGVPPDRRGGRDRPPRQRPAAGDAAAPADRPDRADRRRGGPPVGRLHHRCGPGRRWAGRRPRPRAASLRRRGRRRPDRPASGEPPPSAATADVTIHGQGHRLRRDDVHGAGRTAVHDRLRQRGPGRAAQRRAQGRRRAPSPSRARSSTASRRGSTTSRPCRPAPTRSSAPSTRT